MSDISTVHSNVGNLQKKGASNADIKKYIDATGYSLKELSAHAKGETSETQVIDQDRTWGEFFMGESRDAGDEDIGGIVREVGSKAQDASTYRGPIDDAAQSVGLTNDKRADLTKGMGTTISDTAYGDVWETQLKTAGRFVSRDKDSKGREIVTFKGDDGKDVRAYVNPPEWDSTDFQRFFAQTAPSLIAGGVVGAITKGAGLVGSAVMQGFGQAGTEIARDVVAEEQGSKQGIDETRALVAGGLGAAGSYVSGKVGAWWSGRQGEKILRKIQEGKTLKPHELKRAVENGLDPNKLKNHTPGQMMDDPQTLADEYTQRQGKFGQQAQQEILDSDAAASQGVLDDAGIKLENVNVPETAVHKGVNRARQTALGEEGAAWDRARIGGHMTPETEVVRTLEDGVTATGRVTNETSRRALTEPVQESFDAAMDGALQGRVMKGAAKDAFDFVMEFRDTGRMPNNPAYRVWRPRSTGRSFGASHDLDQARRTLLGMAKNAGEDSNDAYAIYGAFNDWVEDMAQKSLVKMEGGSRAVDGAALYATAVDLTKKGRELFNPGSFTKRMAKGSLDVRQGSKDAARKVLQKIYDAEGVSTGALAQDLFGTPGSVIKQGRHTAVRHIKDLSAAHGERAVMPELKRAYIINTMLGKDGKQLPTKELIANLEAQLNKQSRMVEQLGLTKQFHDVLAKSKTLLRGKTPTKYQEPAKGLGTKAWEAASIISPYRLMVRMIYSQRVAKDLLPKASHAARLRPEAGVKTKAAGSVAGATTGNALVGKRDDR